MFINGSSPRYADITYYTVDEKGNLIPAHKMRIRVSNVECEQDATKPMFSMDYNQPLYYEAARNTNVRIDGVLVQEQPIKVESLTKRSRIDLYRIKNMEIA